MTTYIYVLRHILQIIKIKSLKYLIRPDTPESWRFAHVDVIPATGIMAFGKYRYYYIKIIFYGILSTEVAIY